MTSEISGVKYVVCGVCDYDGLHVCAVWEEVMHSVGQWNVMKNWSVLSL